jgi:hypothetical protein
VNQENWAPWTPLELSHRLGHISDPWSVVGGWALDLSVGEVTRPHADIEIAILRPDFEQFQNALPDMDIYCAMSGEVWPLEGPPPRDVTQFWCWDRSARAFVLDIMIERGTPRTWVYKRDKWINRPRAAANGTGYKGLRYLTPACVLLFKAKALRPKDQIDFDRFAPRLLQSEREWLIDALDHTHSNHIWLDQLKGLAQT